MDELSLFTDALAVADPGERAAFLDRACAGNVALRARLGRLLAAHGHSGHPLDRSPVALAGLEPLPAGASNGSGGSRPSGEQSSIADLDTNVPNAPPVLPRSGRPRGEIGTVVADRYTLVELLGEGGMGSVYLADQTQPVKRQVAVKLIKGGMDSRGVVARFGAERQALALMDHPNIARMFDGGTTHAGQPYFVMELVKGLSLTAYCDRNGLSVPARLELFVAVCRAVQHAHQRGIIHRDLKPGNVLVTEVDGRPTPKVIDFGVAKAIDQKLTGMSLADTAAILGTPTYMSPEQADPSSADVDTRTDVYALGVILYELLVGSPPLDTRLIKQVKILELLRMVREVEPPRPSARLSIGDDTPIVAANRGTEPVRLARALRSELDWVALKALEKDRNRRYESASALGQDVERYLRGEVVEARPPSPGYRLRKFVRRHKGRVVAAGLVFLSLVAGVVGTSLALIEARRQADNADRSRAAEALRADGEAAERARAQAAEHRAREEERVAVSVRAFLQKKLLGQAYVGTQADAVRRAGLASAVVSRDVTVRELLDRAAEELTETRIEDSFPNQPLVQAEILQTIGAAYTDLGEHEQAIALLDRAVATKSRLFGADDRTTLVAAHDLGRACKEGGRADRAVPLLEATLATMKLKLGAEDPETINAMNSLAGAYRAAGDNKKCLPLQQETLELARARFGPHDPRTITFTHNLAQSLVAGGKTREALPLYEEVLDYRRAVLGPDHPNTLTSMNDLAVAHAAVGDRDRALPLLVDCVKRSRDKLGPDHLNTLIAMDHLAAAHQEAGKLDLAVPLFEEVNKLMGSKVPRDHPSMLTSMNNLALAYHKAGDPQKAVPIFKEVFETQRAKLGADHPSTLLTMNNLALAYQLTGRGDLALPLMEEAVRLSTSKLGADHPSTLTDMNSLAFGYQMAGRLDRAVSVFEQTLDRLRATLGSEHPSTITTALNLATVYQEAGNPKAALPLAREAWKFRRARSGPEHPATLGAMLRLASVLAETGSFAEAEGLYREVLVARQKQIPDDWRTFNTRSELGGALLGQKKFAEAAGLLVEGYEGMKKRERSMPPPAAARLPEALDRLIVLSVATNDPVALKQWRAERAKYPNIAPAPRPRW